MSARVSLEEISIWVNRLSNKALPHQCDGHYPIHWIEQKVEERWICFPFELRHLSSALRILLVLRLSDWDLDQWPTNSQGFRLRLNYTICFSGSPAGRQQTIQLFGLHKTMWVNSYNKYPLIYIYLIHSVSLPEPWLMHMYFHFCL